MKCLRCGHCCIKYDVMIVDNPKLGVVEGNIIHKPNGVNCKHLSNGQPGEYICLVHSKLWYSQSPCFDFGQIESSINDLCRVGEFKMRNFA